MSRCMARVSDGTYTCSQGFTRCGLEDTGKRIIDKASNSYTTTCPRGHKVDRGQLSRMAQDDYQRNLERIRNTKKEKKPPPPRIPL